MAAHDLIPSRFGGGYVHNPYYRADTSLQAYYSEYLELCLYLLSSSSYTSTVYLTVYIMALYFNTNLFSLVPI